MKMENTEGCGNLLKAIERGKRNFKIKKKGKMRGETPCEKSAKRESRERKVWRLGRVLEAKEG